MSFNCGKIAFCFSFFPHFFLLHFDARDEFELLTDMSSFSRSALVAAAEASRARGERGYWLNFDAPANPDPQSASDPVQKIIVAAGVATLVVAAAKLYFNMTHPPSHKQAPLAETGAACAAALKTVPLIDASDGELTDGGAADGGEWDMLSPTEKHFTPVTTTGVLAPTEGVFVTV